MAVNYETLKSVSQIGTYVGLACSFILSVISLQFKTARETDPDSHKKTLTPAGKLYLSLLVLSFAITLTSAIIQNFADSKLKAIAEQHGTAVIQNALQTQHAQYVRDLKEQFEGTNGVIEQINKETQQLKTGTNQLRIATTHTQRVAEHAVEAITGGKSYPMLTVGSGEQAQIYLLAELPNAKDVGTFRYEIVELAPPQTEMEKAFCQNRRPVPGKVWDGDSGPILPQQFATMLSVTPAASGITQYRAVMDYKNGRYVQCIDVRRKTCGVPGFDSRSVLWRRNVVFFTEKWPECPNEQAMRPKQ